MKKFLLLLSIVFLSLFNVSMADDELSTEDLWNSWDGAIESMKQNKQVSDETFDKTIESLNEKKNKKIKKKNTPKGSEFHQGNETDVILEHLSEDSLPVISLPVDLIANGSTLPIGHYQVKAIKEHGKVFIEFYQAHYLVAKVSAYETNDDFGEDLVVFAKWEVFSNDAIKIMFGSLDINAYAIIKYQKRL